MNKWARNKTNKYKMEMELYYKFVVYYSINLSFFFNSKFNVSTKIYLMINIIKRQIQIYMYQNI